jgi:hypothetical protein
MFAVRYTLNEETDEFTFEGSAPTISQLKKALFPNASPAMLSKVKISQGNAYLKPLKCIPDDTQTNPLLVVDGNEGL